MVDLLIRDADVFDARRAEVLEHRHVVVDEGRFVNVLDHDAALPDAREVIDGSGALLTPGLIDTHGHLAYVLGDSVSAGGGYITHLSDDPDSLAAYRARYAAAYLPYGVTAVRDVGSTEEDLALLDAWRTPTSDFPAFQASGGALTSREEGRTAFPGHAPVDGPEEARARVRRYHDAGYRDVKLYWRLRGPEFAAALDEAQRLGMRATGHVDFQVLGMDRATDLGLRSFEHAYTLAPGAMTADEYTALWREHVPAVYGDRTGARFHLAMLEAFAQLGPEDPEALALVERLADIGASVSTTLHIFAQQAGAAPFERRSGTPFDDGSGLTDAQRDRAAEGYAVLESYVRRMHEAGIRLVAGADWLEPGRTTLSEVWLLHRAGLSMEDSLQIATRNAAEAIGREKAGLVEPGRVADLVLFRENPLKDADGLFGPKVVVRAGSVVRAGE